MWEELTEGRDRPADNEATKILIKNIEKQIKEKTLHIRPNVNFNLNYAIR